MELAHRIATAKDGKEAPNREQLARLVLNRYVHACRTNELAPIDIVDAVIFLCKSGIFDELTILQVLIVAIHFKRTELLVSILKQVAPCLSDAACRVHIQELVPEEARGILNTEATNLQTHYLGQLRIDLIDAAKMKDSKIPSPLSSPQPFHQDHQDTSDAKPPESGQEQTTLDLTNRAESEHRKNIYLQLKSSMSADEMAHRLVRSCKSAPRQVVVSTLVEACYQESVYNPIYSNAAYRLCRNPESQGWIQEFQAAFKRVFEAAHDLEALQLRVAGNFFGSLLATDSMDISKSFTFIDLTPEQSTPSNRILLQAVFQEMQGELGKAALVTKLHEAYLPGLFPIDTDLESLRFSINFFTAIGLGSATKEMRSRLP